MERIADPRRRARMQQRLAVLSGRFATVRVGGYTEAQRKERMRLLNRAQAAVRGAVSEGVVPGGGVALLAIIPTLAVASPADEEEAAALRCLRRAFEAPLRRLAANAGEDPGAVVAEVLRRHAEARDPFIGYDVLRRAFGDLWAWGILDPTPVVRTAMLSAISAAGMLLTTEASVATIPGQRLELIEASEKLIQMRRERKAAMERRRRLGKQKPPKRIW